MRRPIGLVAAIWWMAGCAADDGVLQVFAALPPTASCLFSTEGAQGLASGLYDPRGLGGTVPSGFVLGLALRNSLPANEGAGDSKIDANDVVIRGVDVCWLRADPEGAKADVIGFDDFTSGIPDAAACEKQPAAQRGFIPVTGFVEAGGGTGVAAFTVLDLAGLRSLYGAAFDPAAIPAWGPVPVPAGNTILWKYSAGAADPSDKVRRDPAWGNYPSTASARVLLLSRVVGQLQSGGDARSAWFVFSIELCIGCFSNACGLADYKQCSGEVCIDTGQPCNDARLCGDGSVCTSVSTCADGSACPAPKCLETSTTTCDPGRWAYSGSIPAVDGCLPFQTGSPACLTFDACNPGG